MIPNKNELKSALLKELYYSNDFTMTVDVACSRVLESFPEISEDEINLLYHRGVSKYKNSVEHAVKDLKDEKFVFRHPESGHGIWKLTEIGIREARKLYIKTYGYDPHESIDEIIKSDIEQIESENDFSEGQKKERLSTYYERKREIRSKAINIHGLKCIVCEFDFESTYGELGKGFIEVHHLVPISSFDDEHNVDPKTDMTVLCANCHRMMHRNKKVVLSIEQLKEIIEQKKK